MSNEAIGGADLDDLHSLARALRCSAPWVVLTGAGCSTASGLAAYRDAQGRWQHAPPITLQEFVSSEPARQRYWLRSFRGWPMVAEARPNAAHLALAELERAGVVASLITQNVDGLHQKAGSQRVIDLHGRLDGVRCLSCRAVTERSALQQQLLERNPDWRLPRAALVVRAPDGDAQVVERASVQLVSCKACSGVLKPDVVFFGESVPKSRVSEAYAALERSGGLLIVGSSLMVFSGYRFAKRAASLGLPIAVVNRGQTRADAFARIKVDGDCGGLLERLAAAI